MDSNASNVKTVQVGSDQSYDWGIVENKFGKTKKYACIDYRWHGNFWRRVVEMMKECQMRPIDISFYKGAIIDEINKTVKLRGNYPFKVVTDKHRFFWRKFFKIDKDSPDPKFVDIGKIIRLPNIAESNDSLSFIIDGSNVYEILYLEENV